MKNAWKNNKIQFPRLLSEIRAIGLTAEQYSFLEESTDLSVAEIDELFERAEEEFDKIKENLFA
jgi:ElaB/YqjD/DUF883 family membrane-anchored ribosome-binding protein